MDIIDTCTRYVSLSKKNNGHKLTTSYSLAKENSVVKISHSVRLNHRPLTNVEKA